jgi:hypothetical protein
MHRLTVPTLALISCLFLMGQQYNVPFSPQAAGSPLTSMMFGRQLQFMPDTGTWYSSPMGGKLSGGFDSVEAEGRQIISAPGEFTGLRVQLDNALTGTDTATFTLLIEETSSNLSCVIDAAVASPADIECEDTCSDCDVVEGNTINLEVVTVGTSFGEGFPGWSLSFVSTNDDEQNLTGHEDTNHSSGTEYGTLCGNTESDTTATLVGCLIPADGVIKDFVVEATACPGGGTRERTMTVQVNGSNADTGNGTLQCNMDGVSCTNPCPTDTSVVTVSAGDWIGVENAVIANSPDFVQTYYAVTYVPDTSGVGITMMATRNTTNNAATWYQGVGGNHAWRTTLNTAEIPAFEAFTIRDVFIHHPTAVTTGTWTTNIMEETSGVVAVAITTGNTESTLAADEPIADNAEIGVQLVPTSTPTDTTGYKVGISYTVP